MKKERLFFCLAAITAAATVTVFLLMGGTLRPPIYWLSLCAIVMGECSVWAGCILSCKKSMLWGLGVVSVLVCYGVATILFSYIMMLLFPFSVKAFSLIHLLLVVLALGTVLIVHFLASNLAKQETQLGISRTAVKQCEALAFSLTVNTAFAAYGPSLQKIYDDIHYSDLANACDTQELLAVLNRLSQTLTAGQSSEIEMQLAQVNQQLSMRKYHISEQSRGKV